jgi:hypothetical protein
VPKDPQRWDEKIISTPFATLTKKDVFDYYSNPTVKNQIMRAVNGGETIIRQSFEPGRDVLRRKDTAGDLIHMTSQKYDELKDVRMSEVHPTFGKKVDFLLADVDPKGKVPWQKTKAIAETIAKTMQTHPDVKKVDVRFSGGRGFYVQGHLGKTMGVDAARNMTKHILDGVARRPDVTFGVPQSGQIRIDTTPLKNRGSVRAPYSLDARTGLVSAPVSLSKLPKVQKTDFTVTKVLKGIRKKAEEFAPGIPMSRKIQPIPKLENQPWMLSIQRHHAHKAGTHYDLRLVDPKTNQAHSFAVPKARLPRRSDRMLLAMQQPTHTADYALNFEGEIPKGTYGAGKVTMPFKEPVEVIKSTADKIHFQRDNGQKFVLFRTGSEGPRWGFKRLK